jgi:hypothetical protein
VVGYQTFVGPCCLHRHASLSWIQVPNLDVNHIRSFSQAYVHTHTCLFLYVVCNKINSLFSFNISCLKKMFMHYGNFQIEYPYSKISLLLHFIYLSAENNKKCQLQSSEKIVSYVQSHNIHSLAALNTRLWTCSRHGER